MRYLMRIVSGLLVVALLGGVTVPAMAVGKDFLLGSKFHGALMLGLGGVLLKGALDAKSDANEAYDFYKDAQTPSAARDFYDESKRNDTRAMIYGVLGVSALVYSVHLFLKGDDSLPSPQMKRGIVNVKGVSLDLDGDVMQGKMGLQLRKGF